MILKNIKTAIFLIVLASVFFVQAQAHLKIAVVDMERVLSNIPQSKAGEQNLKKQFSQREQAVKEKLKQFEEARTNYQKNRVILTPDQQSEELMKLSRQGQELQQEDLALRNDLNQAKQKYLSELEQQLAKIINTIATAEKFDLVYYSGIAFAKADFDLTNRLITEMEKKYKTDSNVTKSN